MNRGGKSSRFLALELLRLFRPLKRGLLFQSYGLVKVGRQFR